MNKTSILTALFLVFSSYLFSQNIKGVIKDKRTKRNSNWRQHSSN